MILPYRAGSASHNSAIIRLTSRRANRLRRDMEADPQDDVRSAHGRLMSVAATLTHGLSEKIRGRHPLARRSDRRELLDEPDVDPAALAANLRDLARLNRLPGGGTTSIAGIEALIQGNAESSILDVGTGGADLPLAFARRGRARGTRWNVTAVDRRQDVVHHAAVATARDDDVTVLRADAGHLPLDDDSVDVAHASLLLHHLEPDMAVGALRELRRVARAGIVINDLRRGLLAFALAAPIVVALGGSPMTRHDGLISLRRAYTLGELDDLLAQAGLVTVWRSSPFLPRVVTAAVRGRRR